MIPPPEVFAETLWHDVAAQFIVSDLSTDDPIGHVALYGMSERDGVAYAAVASTGAAVATGVALEGFALLVTYGFCVFPLRKVYVELPVFNLPSVRSAVEDVATTEGILKEHLYYDGAHHDVHILSISRDAAAAWLSRTGLLAGAEASSYGRDAQNDDPFS